MHRLPFQTSVSPKMDRIGGRIHSDVCGPMSYASLGGARFYVLFKDEFSGWIKIKFMKSKSEVLYYLQSFSAFLKNHTGETIQRLRTDNGTEYVNAATSKWTLIGIEPRNPRSRYRRLNHYTMSGCVSWGSKRQRSTALSTADSEFYAASEGSRDAIWFKALLDELGIDVGTITMYCDNASARRIIEDPENHRRSKHIAVHYFFVRDQQELGTIKMTKVSSHDNVADMFTKALPERAFLRHRNGIGIREVKQ